MSNRMMKPSKSMARLPRYASGYANSSHLGENTPILACFEYMREDDAKRGGEGVKMGYSGQLATGYAV